MLKYCAWCGEYQGAIRAEGYQIRANVCEIDTATICPTCLVRQLQLLPKPSGRRSRRVRKAVKTVKIVNDNCCFNG